MKENSISILRNCGEKRILRKGALWPRSLTERRALAPVPHGKARSAVPRSHRLRFSVTSSPERRGAQPPARLRGVAPWSAHFGLECLNVCHCRMLESHKRDVAEGE